MIMKLYLIFGFFFSGLLLQAQYDNTSLYFGLNNLTEIEKFKGFEKEHRGYYDLEEVRYKQMIVTKDSIAVRTGFEIVISKQEAISKGFTFKDDKMYGVAPLNGVFYKEDNDTIYALYYQYDSYFKSDKNNFVIPAKKGGYFIFMHESNELYSVEFIDIQDGKLSIYSIDHTLVMDKILKLKEIENKKEYEISIYVVHPKTKEMEKLLKNDCFNDKREYQFHEKL